MEDRRYQPLVEAYELHDSVNQTYDEKPYGYHLFMVTKLMEHYVKGKSPEYVMVGMFAAAFHDSIEDARLTYNDVLKRACKYFGNEFHAMWATNIVYALTNEKGRNREERANAKYYDGIREVPLATEVKLCDRLANMLHSRVSGSSMYKKYIKELPVFKEKLCVDSSILDLLECDEEYIDKVTSAIDSAYGSFLSEMTSEIARSLKSASNDNER